MQTIKTNSDHQQPDKALAGPIFILGISQRSGTVFLYDLISQHPDCTTHPTVWEDFFVNYLDILNNYTDAVSKRWKWREGKVEESLKVTLCKYFGDGIINFLSSENSSGKRLLTKTPSIHNLHLFSKFFPNAYLLILIRDGRAVVESRVKTFNETYETAMYKWATAAKEIVDFDKNFKRGSSRYLIIKYEDILNNIEGEIKKILSFLNLDIEKYDVARAMNLPVRGSSTFKGKQDSIHWKPVEKTADFDPLKRWGNWSRNLHEMFNYLGGGVFKLLWI